MTNGTDNPLTRGTVNQTLLFITMLLSREISVPKNPPTINKPWLPAVPEMGMPIKPSLIHPPDIPIIKAITIRGNIYTGLNIFMRSV
jgi:hypothetical protein